ncbi:IclR family transcriptional regulator [Leucobacter sp. L43]|uniref:IclR family transcriptional regulator n=1 Tax=Leucobacter sp. L43 TaxID=2798040 RepID=UPI001902F478
MANSASGESMITRIVRVIETFSEDRTSQTVSDIGRRAGLPPSTAHRLVGELVANGMLELDDEHRVRLGLRLWELALRGSTAHRLREVALPHMERVQSAIREHTQLAVLERDEALCLEKLSHPRAGANIARVAGRLPLHASSSGLVLLAHADPRLRERLLAAPLRRVGPETITDPAHLRRTLIEIRRFGRAIAPGSIEEVSTGVAVPLRRAGAVVAALSVVLPREHPPEAALEVLVRAARGIEGDLRSERR